MIIRNEILITIRRETVQSFLRYRYVLKGNNLFLTQVILWTARSFKNVLEIDIAVPYQINILGCSFMIYHRLMILAHTFFAVIDTTEK